MVPLRETEAHGGILLLRCMQPLVVPTSTSNAFSSRKCTKWGKGQLWYNLKVKGNLKQYSSHMGLCGRIHIGTGKTRTRGLEIRKALKGFGTYSMGKFQVRTGSEELPRRRQNRTIFKLKWTS